jgi:hypothetical protein
MREKLPACGTALTPPQLAKRWGVKPEKVIAFIRSGELRAFDVSVRAGMGRPRFRIPPDGVIEFESRRLVSLPTKPQKRRKKQQPDVIEFF